LPSKGCRKGTGEGAQRVFAIVTERKKLGGEESINIVWGRSTKRSRVRRDIPPGKRARTRAFKAAEPYTKKEEMSGSKREKDACRNRRGEG